MPKNLGAPLTFYPAYCFPLSPTFNAWARLNAIDVHALQERPGFEGQNLYFHLNHPIKWVRLVGVIVALDVSPTRWFMLLDDSTGATIEITCGRPVPTTQKVNTTTATAASVTLEHPSVVPDAHFLGVTATGREIDLRAVDIGTVVKAKGGIGSWRGEKQMLLERISIVRTTNEEAAEWAEVTNFRKSILSVPWMVSEEEEKRARRKAEGSYRVKKAIEERKRRKRREVEERQRAHAK